MRLLLSLLLALAGGAPAGTGEPRPRPDDVQEFVADPVPESIPDTFKDFKVTAKDFTAILRGYVEVDKPRWLHRTSHVAFGDRTGHVILEGGENIRWLVRPGGLAWLEFPGGEKSSLVRGEPKP